MNRPTLAVMLLFSAAHLSAQSRDTTFFVTTVGKDTVAIEQYTRIGNAIAGAWIQNQGGALVHDYALVLRDDGWPSQYVMTLYLPRGHTYLMSVTYGSDSSTRIVVRDSNSVTTRMIARQSYPVGALSIVGIELALAQARRAHMDSSMIILDRGQGPSQTLPVKFFGEDSVRVGEVMRGRVDRDGRLLALHVGQQETQRVPRLNVAKVSAGFVAAEAAAAAARVEITLPPAALQRFVGEYVLTPTASAFVTLEATHLMVRVGNQPAIQLFAQSPTTFFVKVAPATMEFDTDASGNVSAVTFVQGGARQRAVKKP
jgi:Domain of unknown function (DUF3471)